MPTAVISESKSKERAKKSNSRPVERLADVEAEQSARETEVVIRLENVSVEYQISRERVVSLKEYMIRTVQGRSSHRKKDVVQALRDISLEIRAGEIFGVIGRNGAGKSTLLKVLSRVLPPTSGRVWMQGRVAPLLELGAGFHPELTGRENIFLNGALLGHSRALMTELFDSIVSFSEIGDFINAPLRTYSSGMYARMGFAVATAVRPDVLLVDEVLAVGDTRFAEKCMERMRQFRNKGTTMLLVSHSGDTVSSMCDRAAWLDSGKLRLVGKAAEVAERYLR
jgi:ABC-2 type transport system ATP-binding protein